MANEGWPRTCFTHGTMTHLTKSGKRTICGDEVASTNLGAIDPRGERVDKASACQRSGCKQGWIRWQELGGSIDD